MKPTCTVLILNYNGRHLLEEFLPSVVDAASWSQLCDVDIAVVDNASTDGSESLLSYEFPSVKVLLAPNNRYLFALNWAATRLDSDLLVMLNNDIEMTENCLDPLFDAVLSDNGVFSVTPLLIGMDRRTPNGGHYLGEHIRGMLTISLTDGGRDLRPTLFGCRGAMVVRRQRFLEMGGFDELYSPAYWEDVDLSYRAWKRGWRSLYQPQSKMYHLHSASWKADPAKLSRLSAISFRNCWLLTWRTISDPRILASNLYWTLRHYLSCLRHEDRTAKATYHEAYPKWSRAVVQRRKDDKLRVLTDADILHIAGLGDW